ncbi:MAG: copper-translocating P-type ATPase [Verrucomicrobia bacterium]|nr:copper-translocating P-type ATPase [Verrucomicrobiota bacterium]
MPLSLLRYWPHRFFVLDMGGFGDLQSVRYLMFILAAVVQFWPGLRFYRMGIPALLRYAPDMNSLVVLGTTAAFAFSTVVTFVPDWIPDSSRHVYFEASAVIITLVLLGRYLELKARGQAGEAIEKLLGLQPQTVHHIDSDGVERIVPLSDIKPGHVLRVLAGERVPVDAVVASGASHIDESMLTGEPIPVARKEGDAVFAGTLNQNGVLILRATGVGQSTVLAGIVAMVRQAQAVKLPIQQLVDRVTLWFVPAVMVLALSAFVLWLILPAEPTLSKALVTAVTVLIIACPCAMGLATPLSIMVATALLPDKAFGFRRGDALQTLSSTRIVAIDKTGTLTEGRPSVVGIWTLQSEEQADWVLARAAWLEQSSTHPLATALVSAARQKGLVLQSPPNVATIPGKGVQLASEGEANADLRVGAIDWITEFAGSLPQDGQQAVERWEQEACTVVAVAEGSQWLGLIAIADRLRASAPSAVKNWQASGRTVVVITGDRLGTAEAVARTVGADAFHARILPANKAEIVTSLRGKGKVAFVGDGINDAPALAGADVGIAMGSGTDVAVHAAEVVLIGHDLNKISFAFRLSELTLGNIRQNLFWAFGYNVILLPVAAGVLYPFTGLLLSPMLAAGAMAASSVCVVLNALRLSGADTLNGALNTNERKR